MWDQDEETAIRSPHGGPKITWGGPPLTPKTGRYRLAFDLAPPVGGDQRVEVDRLVSLGATRVHTEPVGCGPVESGPVESGPVEAGSVLLEDPDGHEFRVLTPR